MLVSVILNVITIKRYVYEEDIDWDKVNAMSYQEAVQYLSEHSHEIEFLDNIRYPMLIVRSTVVIFIGTILGCLIISVSITKSQHDKPNAARQARALVTMEERNSLPISSANDFDTPEDNGGAIEGPTDDEKMWLRLLWMRRKISLYLWSFILLAGVFPLSPLVFPYGDSSGLRTIVSLAMSLAILGIVANRLIEVFLRCPICGFHFNGSPWKNLVAYSFPVSMQLKECAVCAVRPDEYRDQPGEREAFSLLKVKVLRGFGIAWIFLVAVLIIESLRQVFR